MQGFGAKQSNFFLNQDTLKRDKVNLHEGDKVFSEGGNAQTTI
jgi:hypothetical protein